MKPESPTSSPNLMRRRDAAQYLKSRYGFGAVKTLARLAVTGGGPAMIYGGRRLPLYSPEELDAWARAKLSAPVRSTSERRTGGV